MSNENPSPTASNQPEEVLLPPPLLMEVVSAVVQVGAILLAAATFFVSLLRGGEPTIAGVRAIAVLLATGVVGWASTYLLANLFVQLLQTLRPRTPAPTPATSTQSWEA